MKFGITLCAFLCAVVVNASDNRWSSNGPYGGYFLTVAFDPQNANTLFVSGGDRVFRSRNGGQTYERLDISGADGFPGAFTIRFQPGAPSHMVAAGISIFSSDNQGSNWQEIAHTPAGGDQFMDLEFHPSNGQILYGVTLRKGFFRSTDGGRTWAAKNTGMNINAKSGDERAQVEVDPTNGSIVYALLSSRTMYKSTNGGDSWKALPAQLAANFVTGLLIDPRNPQILYASNAQAILRSSNGGAAWASANCCGVAGIAIDPKSTQTLYAVTDHAYKSTNGGNTWSALNAPIPQGGSWLSIAVHPRSNSVFATGFGAGVFRSLDGGRSWKEFLSKLDGNYIENVKSSAQKPSTITATQAALIYNSANTATSWQLVKSLDLNPRAMDVHPMNANLIAVAGDPAGFAISSDGGRTWNNRGPYSNVREFCNECVQFHPQDQNTIYLAPLGVGMARSNDRGASWSTINSGITDKNISVVAVDPKNGSNVFVATTTAKVFRTTNGGSSWKNSSAGVLASYALAIAVDPTNSNVAYLASDKQPDKGFIYKTTNGGQNWMQKSHGLDSRYAVRSIAIDPLDANTVFAAGEGGIFVTADGGENWSSFDSTGLQQFYLFDIHINAGNPNTLLLGTNGGVYSYTRKTSAPGGPLITQIVPGSAKVGDTVLIQGEHFGGSQGSSAISFNGVSAGSSAAWNDGSISVRVPSGTRSGPVTLTVNGKRSNPFGFQVLATSGNVEPSSGPSAGGTTVTILGPAPQSRFLLTIQFGSTLAKNVRFTPPNIYTCTSPPGSGSVDVKIVTGATVINAGRYTYQ